MMAQELNLVTISEAAEEFGIARATLQHWIADKKLTKYKAHLGKEVFIDADELREKLTPRKRPL
jgi:excisionase family DNA binding protein